MEASLHAGNQRQGHIVDSDGNRYLDIIIASDDNRLPGIGVGDGDCVCAEPAYQRDLGQLIADITRQRTARNLDLARSGWFKLPIGVMYGIILH